MGIGSHSKRKKLSQKHSKKRTKSGKDKIKKPKRRHDTDDDLMSNSSLSCYSSEDDYKSKKRARSRDRKVRKDRKKRVKRSRSVSESSEDDSPRVKKRKRSKKGKDSESRKKRHVKKRKRSPSVSSLSESSDDSEKEVERNGAKERKGTEKVKVKERSVSKRKEMRRSKSRSPFSLNSECHSYGSEDRVMVENNPKRLKSLIVVVHEIEESEIKESNSDGNKAEIVFDHDEYPSRSNDSNDGVNKKEASSFSHEVISEIPKYLDDSNRETVPSDVQISEIPESESLLAEKTEGIIVNKFNTEISSLSTETDGSNCDDLAAILRQQALANFLKRQGKLSANNATDKKKDLNSVLNKSSFKADQVQYTDQKSGKAEEVNCSDVPNLLKGNDASLPMRKLGISRLAEKYTAPRGFADSRTKLGLSTPRNDYIGAKNTWRRQLDPHESSQPKLEQSVSKDSKKKQVSEESFGPNLLTLKKPQESFQPNLLSPKIIIDKDAKRQYTSQEVFQPNLSVPKDAVDLGSSSVSTEKVEEGEAASQASTMVGHNLNEKTNEADGDSQFQQKTMSVMRGGEMVQVSYKVYIPNKAPALARRQLKR